MVLLAALCVAIAGQPASAQSSPPAAPPPRPLPAAPPLPTSPLGRSLSNAYQAIVRTGVSNPAAAQQAEFAYAQALQRARAGDVSGALAASAHAEAAALEAGRGAFSLPSVPLAPPQPPTTVVPPTGVTPPTAGVPITGDAGAVLSPELLAARNEIELASELTHRSLDTPKAHYRRALDAYQSGNAARARREARAAFDAAADALSTVK